ncbi:unnamed protein product [Calicophoron daubneyi]|uniref:Phosphatidylinositol-glycan biosynthesis class W protein n=1 Tax=Calicophoron daubneyi TaxID=300641 RepID=A0AAV2T5L8_CALDB
MDPERKLRHEEFTVQVGASSVLEVILLCIAPFILLGIRNNLLIFAALRMQNFYTVSLLDFSCIILPVIFLLTVASDHASELILVCLLSYVVSTLVLLVFNRGKQLMKFVQPQTTVNLFYGQDLICDTLILTCIMILSIDFPICPRRLAKTPDYGLGLMDTGTGCFILLSGLSASRFLLVPLEKSRLLRSLYRAVLPITTLGLLRPIAISSLGYQHITSEYGTHWNFFLTIGFCRVVSTLFLAFVSSLSWFKSGSLGTQAAFSVSFGCAFLLCSCYLDRTLKPHVIGSTQWPTQEARAESLIYANLEGLTSLAGYCAIFFLAFSFYAVLRKWSLPVGREPSKLQVLFSRKLFFFLLATTVITGFAFRSVGPKNVSRRFANPEYVLLICFICSATAFCSWAVHALFCLLKQLTGYVDCPPSALFYALSSHGLLYFLVSNLLTGFVNISFDTVSFISPNSELNHTTGKYSCDLISSCIQLSILVLYTAFSMGVVVVLAQRSLPSKQWWYSCSRHSE